VNRIRLSSSTGDGVGEDLQRDGSVQAQIASTIHLAHATCAKSLDDFVRTNTLARGQTHGWRRL
jgi:hypothetical protein